MITWISTINFGKLYDIMNKNQERVIRATGTIRADRLGTDLKNKQEGSETPTKRLHSNLLHKKGSDVCLVE